MKLVQYPDKILTTPIESFDFNSPSVDPRQLSVDLLKKMYEYEGVGLAANQIGLPYRVFVMRGHPESFACFNPRIISSEGQEVLEEACLSFPGINVKVKRAKNIRVRFQTPSGETTTETFTGMTARVFQHELDHLDGILFYNRANRYHREKALKGFYNG